MEIAALAISVVALFASFVTTYRALELARHSNTLPVLIELFSEHRGQRLTQARRFVRNELPTFDPALGVEDLPEENARLVRDLAWFYDNLGALVAHDVVDIEPVSGYLGTSVIDIWSVMEPYIHTERIRRGGDTDPGRWQAYFENLARLIEDLPPDQARARQPKWRLAA
jgi:hypothetical protein